MIFLLKRKRNALKKRALFLCL